MACNKLTCCLQKDSLQICTVSVYAQCMQVCLSLRHAASGVRPMSVPMSVAADTRWLATLCPEPSPHAS